MLRERTELNVAWVQAVEHARSLIAQKTLRAQPGPQTQFVESDADIVIYGGAAFAGKTFGLLFQVTRFVENPLFSAVIFRRNTTQVRNPGGLWDESVPLYRRFGARPHSSFLEHYFPSGAKVKFAHLEHEDTVYDWDGAQIPFIGFDQLEHFTRKQFFYMLSRNRSASGVKSRLRATCNPNPDSFLAEFLSWWIDQKTGYPIPERAGKVRWMLRDGDDSMHWADSAEELVRKFRRADLPADSPQQPRPKSVQFIPGTITDNQIGMKKDPDYLSNLRAMQRVERERLLGGNWKIRPQAGLMFQREWCEVLATAPTDTEWVRYWDLAATKKIEGNDPDWSVGVRMGRVRRGAHAGKYVLDHVHRMRETAGKVRSTIVNGARLDGEDVRVGLPQDPGQAGKDQAQQLVLALDGYMASTRSETGDKVTRFGPFSAQAEAGNVLLTQRLLDCPHGEDYLRQLESFPDGDHKDDADATSGAYAMFQEGRGFGLLDFVRAEAEAVAAGRPSAALPEEAPAVAAKTPRSPRKKAKPAAQPSRHAFPTDYVLEAPPPSSRHGGPGGLRVADLGAGRRAPDGDFGELPRGWPYDDDPTDPTPSSSGGEALMEGWR